MQEILIIGAGMAATALTLELAGHANITLAEKSRGMGGRMSTRRSEALQFDHGAQFLTARSDEFKTFIGKALRAGWVAEWQPRVITLAADQKPYKRDWFEPHYVATPSMNALCKAQLRELEALRPELRIALGTEIATLTQEETGRWAATTKDGERLGIFDQVISTAPPRQTEALFATTGFDALASLADASHLPCFSLMLGTAQPLELPFDLAVVKDSPVALIANDGSKPGRSSTQSLLVHADNGWAREHLEDEPEQVEEVLLAATESLTGIDRGALAYRSLHRWRYAKTETALALDYLVDADRGLAACGDWCLGATVESAFLSGQRLGIRLRERLAG